MAIQDLKSYPKFKIAQEKYVEAFSKYGKSGDATAKARRAYLAEQKKLSREILEKQDPLLRW